MQSFGFVINEGPRGEDGDRQVSNKKRAPIGGDQLSQRCRCAHFVGSVELENEIIRKEEPDYSENEVDVLFQIGVILHKLSDYSHGMEIRQLNYAKIYLHK